MTKRIWSRKKVHHIPVDTSLWTWNYRWAWAGLSVCDPSRAASFPFSDMCCLPLVGSGGRSLSVVIGGPCWLCPPTLLASPASSTMGSVEVGPGVLASAGSQTVDSVRGCVIDTSLEASFSATSMVLSTDGVRSVDGRPIALDSRCRSASSLDMVIPRMNLMKRSP